MENFSNKPKEMSDYSVTEGFEMIKKGGIEVGMHILEANNYDLLHASQDFFDAVTDGLVYAIKNGNNNLASFKSTVSTFQEIVKTPEVQQAIADRVEVEVKKGHVRFLAENKEIISFDNESIKNAMISGLMSRIHDAEQNQLLP
jgi:hypothetical protein